MKAKIFNIIKYFLITILIIISTYLLYKIYKLNILVIKYYIIILLLVLLLNILFIFKLIRKKTSKISKIIFMILTILISLLYLYGTIYIDKTIKFVSNMTEEKYETRKYEIYVLKEKNIKTLGYLNIYEDSKYIKEKQKTRKLKSYEDIGSLLGAIYNNEIDAVILDKAYVEMLKENDVDFIKEAKKIEEFEVRKINEETIKKVDIRKDPFILYISGSDSRGSINLVARSDVNIAVVINPKTNKILLVSIPRDYYVRLNGTTGSKDKLTHAGIYGVEKSMNTVGDLLDQDINYYLKVGFQTVVNVVDVVDGIDIYSEQDIKTDANRSCKVKKGINHLDGECALAFSRERHSYQTGDRHRGENQQQVITKLVEKLNNPKYLTRYNQILKAMDGSFKTNMTYEEITNFIKYQLNNLKKWKVESISLDGTDSMQSTYSMGSRKLYVMIPNEKTVATAKEKINAYLGGN